MEWHRPNHRGLRDIFKNPIYAGAYAYGRRQVDPRQKQPGKPLTGRVTKECKDWHVLLKDHYPAYITWEQHQRNLARIKANKACAESQGVARQGGALLVGLLVCGHCGYRMRPLYPQNCHHRYICSLYKIDLVSKSCQGIAGAVLDQFITQQVLAALEPAALELSLASAQHIEQERTELDQLWHQRLERSSYEADYAGRHYRRIEPENRLVARQLARDWEEKLQAHQELQEEYQRFTQQQLHSLTQQELDNIRQLAQNIPALWNSSTTTNAQRKEVIRQIIERIIITVQGDSEWVEIRIEWVGGTCTQAQIIRPVGKLTQLSNYEELCQRVRQLNESGLKKREIAESLNQEGFYPPKGRKTFTERSVRTVMRRLGLCKRRINSKSHEVLQSSEWWLSELAQHLNMAEPTLLRWCKSGWVKARQQDISPYCWIIWADKTEIERLQKIRQLPRGYASRQRWLENLDSNDAPQSITNEEDY